MQTIIGSGGAIGTELAKYLPQYTDKIRLASRNPKQIIGNEEILSVNLLNSDETNRAVKDSEVVYLTVGLEYKATVWERDWPVIMNNVIESCKKYKAKLVFFDNIYMYDPNHLNGMDESTPMNPCSRKGIVRKMIFEKLMNEVKEGNLTALVARSADFYGPSIKNTSVLTQTVFDKLANGKSAQWFSSINKKHSFTYVPDAAKATAILGNSSDAYNEVWHLPTHNNPPTGLEWIEMIAKELNKPIKYRTVSKNMLKIIGFFVPTLKEFSEMNYQYDRDYVFVSDKFEEKFKFSPKDYSTGIKEVVNIDYLI